MKLIALEEHFLTPAIRAAWAASPIGQDGTDALDRGEIEARLDDLGAGRLALMDESGVDVQVLSVTTPALHNLEPAPSVALARQTNDLLAATIARHPTRFEGFATLPMPSPADVAPELERGVTQLGLAGAMLCGRTRDKPLDHPDYRPLFATAARLRVPLYIHPQVPPQVVREASYSGFSDPMLGLALSTFGLGWHYEAGLQFVRLLLAGVFDEHPGLQIILGHWGEVVLFYAERLEGLGRVARLQRPVADYFRHNLLVTPSGMWSQDYLQRALALLGPERLLFSADYPYQYRPGRQARAFLEAAALPDDQRARFAHGNWEQLRRAATRL